MIKFKNIKDEAFLAVGTIQRKFTLNGEKSLSGILYDGDDVLNKFDKGWSLEFDGEPYVVTYFDRNDSDNTLAFDAIHEFFWKMAKSVLYTQTTGSHTVQWYLDQMFANTGYTYALNFSPKAISKDNWGMKTKIALFNDIISSIGSEFEINGTLISIFEKTGTDLSTIVRYGFNLSDMSIENNAAGFVTYGEGFGAYADQQNQSGPRLHTTYTSPLASVYGILQAEPVDDQRYTVEANLIQAIKEKVDNSFAVSIKLSLYDLRTAGYPYKMANVGDWLMAIDEKLNFKQRIRIIAIDDEFDTNGNRISYTVTAGNLGIVQKYQEANASLSSQINNAIASANEALNSANQATISANGKNTSYYLDGINDLPTTANNGDLAWVKIGDGSVLYIYTKKSDGNFYWKKRVDPETGEQIADGVNNAVTQSKDYSDKAIADNKVKVDASIKSVDDKANKLKADQAVFDAKAQGYANQALNDAKANTSAAVQQTAKNATDALEQAKADLTSGIAKEATDRQNAVNALDKAAQGYANQAVAKEVSDRQNAVSALDSKTTGAINSARSDAQSALNALQVGGRNLFAWSKTLPWGFGSNSNATVTVEDFDANTKMYHIKSDKGHGQSAGMYIWGFCTDRGLPKGSNWSFSADIKGTGYINNFGAEGSTNVVTKGAIGTDWSRLSQSGVANNADHISLIMYFDTDKSAVDIYIKLPKLEIGNMPTAYIQAPEDIVQDYTNRDNAITQSFTQYQQTNDGKVTKAQSDATQALGLVATKVSQSDFDTKTGDLNTKYTNVKQTVDGQTTEIADIKQTATDQSAKINTISSDVDGTKQSISDIQTKDGQQDTRMGTIETSVSGVKSDFSTYKTSNDGDVKMAQTTAQTAVDGLKTKVSQTDYDKKTGDLSTKVSTAQQTADSANTTIGDYKKANDGRVSSAESAIKQNTDAISSKVSQTDYDQKTGKLDGQISSLNQTAKDITTSIGKVSDRVDSFNAPNLFQNSEFETDTGYRTKNGTVTISGTTKNNIDGKYNGTVIVTNAAGKGSFLGWWSNRIPVQGGQVYSASVLTHFNQSGSGLALLDIWFVDKDNQRISAAGSSTGNKANPYWVFLKSEGFIAPQNAVNMEVSLLVMNNGDGAQTATFTQPMVTATDKVKPYTPNITDKQFSTQQQKIDSISSIVSDPNTGLTKRVQTAEGFITSATDRLGKVENKSTSTADGLTREIKDRTDGDSNTLQQGKDFTTSQISNSETGMKSFVNQTISGLQIGAISSDVNALKLSTQWQAVNVDNLNNMTNQGKFFIQGGNHTNAPVGGWFYLTVDKPINGRITQVAWADSNPTMQYTRILFGSNWSNWNRVVTNETVLSIFNDSWSLGTSANDGITKKLITGINGQADGTLVVKGASIILDGAVKATADFYAKGGNFTNLNASNITVGTLNGNTVNITNINASNIVTGAISGANLNINLNTGQVVFQKGRIYNEGVQTSGAGIDVNIDQRYIATSDGYSSSVLKNGMMMLYQSTLVNSGKDPYFQIDNFGTQLTLEGARLRGSKNISLGVYSSSDVPVFGGHSELNGAVFSDGYAARIEGKNKGVKISGGAAFGSISPASPNILVGVDSLRSGFGGDRIAVNAKYFYLLNQYATTTSSGANMFLTNDGAVIRSSSSSKYKLNINYEQSSETANKLLTIDPALWHDKFESEQLDKFHDIGVEPERTIDIDKRWYYGIIAEDLVKAGLEHLVMRDTKTGEVEGVEYSKIGVALIPIIRELRNRLNEQYVEIERLKEQSK